MSDLIFLDDERSAMLTYPHYRGTMYTCRTVAQAIGILKRIPVDLISLDHDLAGEDSMDLIHWMEDNDHWVHGIFIHTMNPAGRERLQLALAANGYRQTGVSTEVASNGRVVWTRPIGYTRPVRAWWNQEKDELP